MQVHILTVVETALNDDGIQVVLRDGNGTDCNVRYLITSVAYRLICLRLFPVCHLHCDPGSLSMGVQAVESIGDRLAVVLKHHGVISVGRDLRQALEKIGMGDLLIRKSGILAIHAEQLDCDYYQMLRGDPEAINAYRGEYMTQYSWAELTAGKLWFQEQT